MKIQLKNIKQEEFDIEVESTDITILNIKLKVEEKYNYDSSKIKFLLNGFILNDQKKLVDYNFKEGEKIIISNLKIKTEESNVNINSVGNEQQEEEDERKYSADIKVEDVVQIVASIMKVLCTKNKNNAEKYFKNLEEDNPEIKQVLKQKEKEFKQLLYSPVTEEDKNIFNKFYKGELINKEEPKETLLDEDFYNIEKIAELGFDETQVKEAYLKFNKNVERAIDYLLNKKI